jgi:hypothetical protein
MGVCDQGSLSWWACHGVCLLLLLWCCVTVCPTLEAMVQERSNSLWICCWRCLRMLQARHMRRPAYSARAVWAAAASHTPGRRPLIEGHTRWKSSTPRNCTKARAPPAHRPRHCWGWRDSTSASIWAAAVPLVTMHTYRAYAYRKWCSKRMEAAEREVRGLCPV